jgi:hypothetical protein
LGGWEVEQTVKKGWESQGRVRRNKLANITQAALGAKGAVTTEILTLADQQSMIFIK